MPNTPPSPYVPKNPKDLIRAEDWNAIQVSARTELQSHNHTGGDQGVKLTGDAIAASAAIKVASVEAPQMIATTLALPSTWLLSAGPQGVDLGVQNTSRLTLDAAGNLGVAGRVTSTSLVVNGPATMTNATATDQITAARVTVTNTLRGPGSVPAGGVMPFAGNAAPPGWLLCNGALVSRATFADLFAVIGTTYGAGDGSTTFALPDLRGRTLVGVGQGAGLSNRALGASGGLERVTLTANELPSHTHTGTTAANGSHSHTGTTNQNGSHTHSVNDPSHTHSQWTINDDFNSSGGSPPGFVGDTAGNRTWNNINASFTGVSINAVGHHDHAFGTSTVSAHDHTFTTNATGGGASIENMQPFVSLNYIIRA